MKDLDDEIINNASLIINDLEHILFELEREDTSYFRVARESHQVLLRFMVEALRGTANLFVTGKYKTSDKQSVIFGDNSEFYESVKTKIDGCKNAWRFSDGKECLPPEVKENDSNFVKPGNKLLPFYDLLARIQSPAFMRRYTFSKAIIINDDEMYTLEWLHESIRNDYEHFIPRFKLGNKHELANASLLCLTISKKLLMESGNIISTYITNEEIERPLFDAIIKLDKLR